MRISLAFLACLTFALPAADGPGVPDRTYPANHVRKIIGHAYVPNAGKTRFVAMHNGYLVFTSFKALNPGDGALSVFDIGDPYQPVLKYTTTGFRSLSTGWGVSENFTAFSGNNNRLRLYDLTDTTNPQQVGTLPIPFKEVGTTFMQWPYLYVGGHPYGTGDNSTPELVIIDLRRAAPNHIVRTMTRGELGFRGVHICIVGNLMSVVAGGNADGGAFYDISDPETPVLLSRPRITRSYGGWMCGDMFFSGHEVFDISDPTKPRFLSNANYNGYYPQFQKRLCFTKAFDRHSKLALRWVDMDTQQVFKTSLSYAPGADIKVPINTIGNETEMPVGNLIVTGDYGSNVQGSTSESGAFLIPFQAAIDTTTPEVVKVMPAAGAIHQALTSRIGLVFDKHLDNRTVTAANITIRPLGGATIAGRFRS